MGPPSERRLGVLQLLRRGRGWFARPQLRPYLLGLGFVLFIGIVLSSALSVPDGVGWPNLWLVAVLTLITAPLTMLVNAMEYRVIGQSVDIAVPMRTALRVTLLATVANYLPAPGGVAVRTIALRQAGAPVKTALRMNLVAALVWLGVTGLAAGAFTLTSDELGSQPAIAMVLGLVVLGSAVAVLWRRDRGVHWATFASLLAVEMTVVALSAVRTFVALRSIGYAVGIGPAVGISASAVLAAAVGIAPAGLGIRETFAGGLAAAFGVPAAVAIAASAVDRVASQVGVLLVSAMSGVRWADLRGPAQPAKADSVV